MNNRKELLARFMIMPSPGNHYLIGLVCHNMSYEQLFGSVIALKKWALYYLAYRSNRNHIRISLASENLAAYRKEARLKRMIYSVASKPVSEAYSHLNPK
jgi:hypothetical protein